MEERLLVMKQDLGSGYRVESVSKSQYDDFRKVHEPVIFPNRFDIHVQDALASTEREAVVNLGKALGNPYEMRLGLFLNTDMIGWSYGIQTTADTFRMATTGIVAEHQRKGVYSRLLGVLAEHLKEKGFQTIFSRHYATDNQVIIPKLRFGFLISGFELTEEYGLLLRLCYYFNETRRKVLHVRSGFQQPDDEVWRLVRKYD